MTCSKSLIHCVPHCGAPSAGAVRAKYNSYGVTIGLKYSYVNIRTGQREGTLESTTVLSGQAMIQKTSHSAKLATFAGLSFPNANKYGFFPLSKTIFRNREMRVR